MKSRTNVKCRVANLLATILLALLLCCAAPASANTGAILMYHHVSPTVEPGAYARALTVNPREFEEQLAWLQQHDCQAVLVDQLWADTQRGTLTPCEVALTFDDGYADVAAFAEPLLLRYGDSATFYIVTGFIGLPDHMTIAQLRAAQKAGLEVGAHTVHHVDLTKLTAAAAYREIAASGVSLRNWLGEPITSFAYPSGKVNEQVAAMVRALGFTNAVTTNAGRVRPSQNAYELPRYRILRGKGLRLLAAVFAKPNEAAQADRSERAHIARERTEGNDPQTAEAIAAALLARRFPEQILKVHVVTVPPATVAGIVLSGVKFHQAINRARFVVDVRQMIADAFAAGPKIDEVDVWATVPIAVSASATVSGDYAAPAAKTVFSAAVVRAPNARGPGSWDLGITYWDPAWL